ncbi:hypothetical protein B6D29_00425 [Microgenomates bacterium UTCPR1]|jgi:hypothetical protein|nr:MAG: hypothetical protein B6D29_00425 [Microgenomates bacterium UTCPR1]
MKNRIKQLVFIDESGDTGRKISEGSSRFFVIGMVIFEDHDEALACDQRIELLKRELNKSKTFEFHFQNNSDKVRRSFLESIIPYSFIYFAVVIDKDPNKLVGDGFNVKESFYKYACHMVFSNAKPYLDNAIVVLDKSGSPTFQHSLKKYLNLRTSDGADTRNRLIKKIKQQHSHSNNLLQIADYVSGIINRKYQKKKNWQSYHKLISSKEMLVQKWPK